MRSKRGWPGLLLCFASLAGCSGYPGSQNDESARAADKAACEKSGGRIEAIGKAQALACVKYYADGGKACRSDSDCASSVCFNPAVLDRGVAAEGTCARSDHDRFGCNSRIRDGKVEFAICQD